MNFSMFHNTYTLLYCSRGFICAWKSNLRVTNIITKYYTSIHKSIFGGVLILRVHKHICFETLLTYAWMFTHMCVSWCYIYIYTYENNDDRNI